MNKKLLTAAIGAALAAGPMLASTAVADVKVYGKVHVSVDYLDAKDAGSLTNDLSRKATTVSSNASRWGIDVSEKLGGDLKAIAKLEQQINVDGESSSQDTRNRYVGLNGKFGQIIAGNMDTPFKEISRTVELFPEYIGDNRNIMSDTAAAGANTTRGWDLRPANSVRYDSPSMNGFVLTYHYSADAVANTAKEDNSNRLWSVGAKYSKGPLYVAYSRESHRYSTLDTSASSNKMSETGDRLGASYTFGAFKLVGVWQSLSDIGGTDSGTTSVKRKAWTLGGAYTAGNNVFKLQYAKADDLSNTTAGASAPETGAKMWALGWDHLFSKTTKVYLAYAKTDNGTSAAFRVNGPSAGAHTDVIAPVTGADPSAWSVGMIVDF